MSNTLTDSQKLSILVNWLGAHSLLSDGKERKFCSDMAADLCRIASDLETLQAANEIPKSELEKWMDMGYKELEQYGPVLSKPFAPRSPLDTLNEYNEAKKLQSERDYWRIRAGSAEDYIEALWGLIEDPSETNRIHAKVRRSEWMSYVESPEGIK